MIKYTGIRTDLFCSVVVHVAEEGKVGMDSYPLHHICRHSPDGFQWGYGGSGPADLALAILSDYFARQGVVKHLGEATKLYQDFKWDFLAKIREDGWSISDDQIQWWIEERRQTEDG